MGRYSLPSPETKKAVTLCLARFDRELTSEELYLFGTIGHPDERAEPSRAEARVRDQSYDRWRCVGLRYFFHNYSLVCAIGPSSQDGGISVDLDWERGKFLKHYVEMGARLALIRARLLELQEDWRDIQGQEMDRLRLFHQNLVDFRNAFGILWTAEGTQRTEVEQMWRKISGLDERAKELEECLEQTLDFYEAQAADKLNRVMAAFQILFVIFAVGQIVVGIVDQNKIFWTVPLAMVAAIGCWVWLLRQRVLPAPQRPQWLVKLWNFSTCASRFIKVIRDFSLRSK